MKEQWKNQYPESIFGTDNSFSISSALPPCLILVRTTQLIRLSFLVSLPSIGIMVMLLLNGLIERFLSERIMIVTGL